MSNKISRRMVINGCGCRVDLTPEADGFSYEVWQEVGPSQHARIATGWTLGKMSDGLEEAYLHGSRVISQQLSLPK